jgi:hypothetical protein
MIKEYTRKPYEVQAMRLTNSESTFKTAKEWMGSALLDQVTKTRAMGLIIRAAKNGIERVEVVNLGDYIVKKPDGHFHRYTEKEFKKNFEAAITVENLKAMQMGD